MSVADDNKSATSSAAADRTLSVPSMSEVVMPSEVLSHDDRIKLKLIQVSGKTAQFLFDAKTTVASIVEHVYDNWPAEWTEETKPTSRATVQLIFHGRFLRADESLECKLDILLSGILMEFRVLTLNVLLTFSTETVKRRPNCDAHCFSRETS